MSARCLQASSTEPGQFETSYTRTDESEAPPSHALVRVYRLPRRFPVARRRATWRKARGCAMSSAGLSATRLLFIGVMGCAGGWFITRRVLKRIDDMTETTRTIMAGDLNGRLKVAGTGDELDRLAQNLNQMLDRIGELMHGMQRGFGQHRARSQNAPDAPAQQGRRSPPPGETPDELKAALEANIEESDNLIRIFNALLMIARLEAGNAREGLSISTRPKPCATWRNFTRRWRRKPALPLEIHVDDDLPVHGSRELLGQAVANLLDNALKYAAPAESEPPLDRSPSRRSVRTAR